MGSMTVDEEGQGKRLTLFLAWNCVVVYVLCEALYCHAGKFQVRYFARNDLLSFVHEPGKTGNNGCRLKRLRG